MLEQNNLQSSTPAVLATSLYETPRIEIIELEIEGIIAASGENNRFSTMDFGDGGSAF